MWIREQISDIKAIENNEKRLDDWYYCDDHWQRRRTVFCVHRSQSKETAMITTYLTDQKWAQLNGNGLNDGLRVALKHCTLYSFDAFAVQRQRHGSNDYNRTTLLHCQRLGLDYKIVWYENDWNLSLYLGSVMPPIYWSSGWARFNLLADRTNWIWSTNHHIIVLRSEPSFLASRFSFHDWHLICCLMRSSSITGFQRH